ncbi:hypothetical protein MMC11_001280 [Xylographa trunciseda]|nr:hypothetical protein [Xylographa trunciseda]
MSATQPAASGWDDVYLLPVFVGAVVLGFVALVVAACCIKVPVFPGGVVPGEAGEVPLVSVQPAEEEVPGVSGGAVELGPVTGR